MGVVHPIVLENYKWDYPASLIELDNFFYLINLNRFSKVTNINFNYK